MRRAALALSALIAAACGGVRPTGPPKLELGRQSCHACAMAVSDGRVAAAIVADDPGAGRVDLIFDDIGCALVYDAAHPEIHLIKLYARDYETEAWLDAESASFVRSDGIATPMRYGLAAFANSDRAQAARGARGGEVLSLGTLLGQALRGDLRPQGVVR